MKSKFLFILLSCVSLTLAAQTSVQFEGKSFFALSVANTATTSAWYEKLFDLKLVNEIKTPDGKIHVRIIGNDHLLLEILQNSDAKSLKTLGIENPSKAHGYFKVGFYVRDLASCEKYFRENNVEIKHSFDDKPTASKVIIISDINGQLIQFIQKL